MCKSSGEESKENPAKTTKPGPKDSSEPLLDNWGLSESDIEAAAAEFEKSMKTILGDDDELLKQWNEFADKASFPTPGIE